MIYDLLAPFYDEFNGDVDYEKWAQFVENCVKRHSKVKTELAVDLGCGTGSMTIELARRGYDMIGIDYSSEMLDVARQRSEQADLIGKILWLCQNMCSFELYGTVELAVCCLDGINHLTKKTELDKCFALVHNYLVPGGLFIFDINGKHKFESVYSDNSYIIENDNAFCVWQNCYNANSGICDFYITLFENDGNGKYTRCDDIQREKMYTLRSIKNSLAACNLEFVAAYSDFEFNTGDDTNDRIYIVARCKK